MIFEPTGAGVTDAGPQAAMWPSRMTMTALSSGWPPVPSMTRAPRRTTVLIDWACETNGRQNRVHRVSTMARMIGTIVRIKNALLVTPRGSPAGPVEPGRSRTTRLRRLQPPRKGSQFPPPQQRDKRERHKPQQPEEPQHPIEPTRVVRPRPRGIDQPAGSHIANGQSHILQHIDETIRRAQP